VAIKYPDKNEDQGAQALTSGFALQMAPFFRDSEIHVLQILLPSGRQTKRYLEDLEAKALAEMKQAALERSQALDLERAEKAKDSTDPDPRLFVSAASKKAAEQLDPVLESQSLDERQARDLLDSDNKVPIYDWAEPLKLLQKKKLTPDSEVHKRSVALYRDLKAKGHLRRIVQTADLDALAIDLTQLGQDQPHFIEVVNLVQHELALARARGTPLQLSPILLYGDPGVGKTYFTQALAKVLGAPLRRHAFDSATTEAALTGSDKNWANTSYGLLFELLCLGDAANPIILLDEIDKAGSSYSRSPLAPLHTLLEPITASRVMDISVEVTFNASHVTWIGTANNPARIPEPIRSRFTQFDIQLPTGLQAIQVACVVADSVHRELALADLEPVSPKVVKLIAHLVPREQGQVLRRAFACAVASQRRHIERQDLPPEVLLADDEVRAPDSADASARGGTNGPGYLH
jgi:ATP-dependent Lon protease